MLLWVNTVGCQNREEASAPIHSLGRAVPAASPTAPSPLVPAIATAGCAVAIPLEHPLTSPGGEVTKLWASEGWDQMMWQAHVKSSAGKGNRSKYRLCLLCGLSQRWCFNVSAISTHWPRQKKRYWRFLSLLVGAQRVKSMSFSQLDLADRD